MTEPASGPAKVVLLARAHMPLWFNTILEQVGLTPPAVRLLRHRDKTAAKGRTPYDLWKDDRPAFEKYQSLQSFRNRPYLAAPYWASFVVGFGGETLLAGIYVASYGGVLETDFQSVHTEGIEAAQSCDMYKLSLDERFSDLEGRLVIQWGDGERKWIQRADRQNKPVIEIRRAFQEPKFPGFTRFISPLSKIAHLPSPWAAALSSSRGVYLLTCPKTREQYVGSAAGPQGFLGRWLEYARNGHGGNIALKSREPSDYQITILEVAGSSASSMDILVMETLWKRKLQSREMGLNRNG